MFKKFILSFINFYVLQIDSAYFEVFIKFYHKFLSKINWNILNKKKCIVYFVRHCI